MGSVQGRIQIDAEPSVLWQWVTDPAHFPDYVEGWVRGDVVTPNATGQGAEYHWTGAFGPLRLDAHERVVAWREGEHVGYQGTLARIPFRSSMGVEPAQAGRSRLEVHIDWHLPLAYGGAAADRLLRPVMQADVDRSLERVAEAFASDRRAPGIPDRRDVVRLYRKRAGSYDVATQLYYLVGFPLHRARRWVADSLALHPGDTVVELCCGTGANFELLQERVGPTGRIIGVDLTDRMLEQARTRVERNGWNNVELVLSDVAAYEFPERVNGIFETLALPLCREYDEVVARGARALAPGGRFVSLDLQEPEGMPEWLIRAVLPLASPYGVTRELAERDVSESIQRHFPKAWKRDFYFGLAYLAVGEKPATCAGTRDLEAP